MNLQVLAHRQVSLWGMCNNYLERGGGGIRGGHRGKSQLERGGVRCKICYIEGGGGALLFSLFFTNWKSGRGAIRVQIFILAYTGIKLGNYQELQVF